MNALSLKSGSVDLVGETLPAAKWLRDDAQRIGQDQFAVLLDWLMRLIPNFCGGIFYHGVRFPQAKQNFRKAFIMFERIMLGFALCFFVGMAFLAV